MGDWINKGNDYFNLDKFFHIWIEKSVNGYFIMGESDKDETFFLSGCFQCPLQCSNHMAKITGQQYFERVYNEERNEDAR